MFRNFIWSIVLFYAVFTLLLLAGAYYSLEILGMNDPVLLGLGLLLATLFGGYALAKLAVDPLREHFEQLERFSKETLHELNLPISTIMTNLSMLRKNLQDERSQKRLQRIEMACDMLQTRYDELDYMIKKQMRREIVETVDLQSLIEQRIAFLSELYGHAEFELDLEAISLKMDKMGFSKVIDNLIDNAVKYSGSSAQVAVRLHGTRLEIEDRGVGMDEVELFRIFDRYYQEDAATPGFGIGLGMVKDYCDRYKITLHVESQKGKGTTMILDFRGVQQ